LKEILLIVKSEGEILRRKRLSVTFFSIFVLIGMTIIQVGGQQTKVYVSPESYTVPDTGLTFTLNITVQDVHDLYGWEFKLYYPNDILNGASVTEGPFLKTGGVSTAFLIREFVDSYNATHGRVRAVCLRFDPTAPGVDGNGVLATITFTSTAINGPEVLHLDDVKLSDSEANMIPYTTVDGEVTVIPEFPEALILPLLIVLTSVAMILRKTARSTKHRSFDANLHSTSLRTEKHDEE